MTLVDITRHSLIHFGPSFGMIAIIVWMAWRTGQLAQPKEAAALPLTVTGINQDDRPQPKRFPIAMLVLAVLLGIGIGVPIATTLVASSLSDPGAKVVAPEAGHE